MNRPCPFIPPGSIKRPKARRGFAYVAVMVAGAGMLVVMLGLLQGSYLLRHRAVAVSQEAAAAFAAEAGYEQAVYWMGQQPDMLTALQDAAPGLSASLTFPESQCSYQIDLYAFVGARPVYRISCLGQSGAVQRRLDTLVMQAVGGWDMGTCRVPTGSSSTTQVYFRTGDIVDLPLHVNRLSDSPDDRDLYIYANETPQFLGSVTVSESRYRSTGYDKYGSVMGLFQGGIYFDQPQCKITDTAAVAAKITRMRDTTLGAFRFTPTARASLTRAMPAVQLEFYVEGGVGKVRITRDATIRGYRRPDSQSTWDWKITPGSDPVRYERYNVYCYHVIPAGASGNGYRTVHDVSSTYVTQSQAGIESDPGGQIYVNGNVVIGGNSSLHSGDQVVKGRITIVATGNIYVADSIRVDGTHDADGKPTMDNSNVLSLMAKGVIKIVDPGLSSIDGGTITIGGQDYEPIGIDDAASTLATYRCLPDPLVIEAALTIGEGGWGAENVQYGSYGGRKEYSGTTDNLILTGAITEACRGVVGLVSPAEGFIKIYRLDARYLTGILPGDIGLRGKYVPTPAGWMDLPPGS